MTERLTVPSTARQTHTMAIEYKNSHRAALGHLSWIGLAIGLVIIFSGLGAASREGADSAGAVGALAVGNYALMFSGIALLLWLLAHSISYDRANADVNGAELRERKRVEKAQRDL